jgi:branched-chain amino acid aminotransferase
MLLPENGVRAEERNLTLHDLWNSDEAFICGTGAEIRPLVKIDGRTIGEGAMGPVTRKAIGLYEMYIKEHGEPIEY